MLPYADEPQPQARSVPFVTIGIILVCIAVFAHEVSLGQAGAEAFSRRWGFTPADFWAGRGLVTLVTALFLHAGLLHIAGNLLFLWVFGWANGRGWWSRSFRNWLLLSLGITLLAGAAGVVLHGAGGLTTSLVRSATGAGVIALALLDGVARLLGRRALLGSSPHANRSVALLQIVAALTLAASLLAA